MLGMTAFASGCGSEAPESIAFADEASAIAEPPTAEFTDEERQLINFHAEWLCELQRRTFANLDETESARIGTLDDTGLSRVAYDQFLSDVLPTQSARDAVLYRYQETCRAK